MLITLVAIIGTAVSDKTFDRHSFYCETFIGLFLRDRSSWSCRIYLTTSSEVFTTFPSTMSCVMAMYLVTLVLVLLLLLPVLPVMVVVVVLEDLLERERELGLKIRSKQSQKC